MSMHRINNSNSRCNHHHPEYSQYHVGPRRSSVSGTSGGSFSTNRRQHGSRNHSWSIPEVVRETGLILEVKREYGRILSQSNFSTPNVHIYFSLSTLVNDAPLSVITDNLTDVFQAGAMVEIEVEGGISLKELRDNVHLILTCTSIRPSTETGRKPELVPMIVIQDDREIPLALRANHELIALPRQVFPIEEVTSAFMAKKSSVTTDIEWPEFATIGHSIEGRILCAPPWIRDFTNPTVKKIALSIQRFGRDREGFAVIKEHIGRGVVLTPIDEEDKKICGEIFFPYEMRTNASYTVAECEETYRLGSKWYFRACPELPSRKYKYRVYSLKSLDDIANGDFTAQERFSEQTVMTDQGSTDVSTSTMETVTSTNHQNNSDQLIEFDNGPLLDSSPSSFSKATQVIQVTPSSVNFDPRAPTASNVHETVILQSSNSSDATGCDLLVDFNTVDVLQDIAERVRHFHVLDEDFTLSSFNFDFEETEKCNHKAEMLDFCNHGNNEVMCMASQDKESVNADLNNMINGPNMPKKQLLKVESNNCLVEFATCKSKMYEENCSLQCNGNSKVEQLVDIGTDSAIIGPEMNVSDDDAENENSHAVERRDDNGWWFTRHKTDLKEDMKANDELTRLPCYIESAGAAKLNSTPQDDKPLLILSDDNAKNCDAATVTLTPHLPLPNILQNDDVYTKFFAGLLRK